MASRQQQHQKETFHRATKSETTWDFVHRHKRYKSAPYFQDNLWEWKGYRLTFSCCYLLSGDQWLCKFLVTKEYFTWEKSSIITAFYWLVCVAGVERGRGLRGRGVLKMHPHGYHFIVLYTNMVAMTSYENDLLSCFNACQFHTWYKIIADIQKIQHDQVTKRR